ncbi:MAG: general secretion pathway protein GspK [Verrucomicrobiia bacterium]|jgi:general secretion pathway protein K
MNSSGFKLQQQAGRRHGAILIVVLWVVLLLSLMVSTFAFTMHIETRLTSYHNRELRAKAMAMAGIEFEKALLAAKVNKAGQVNSSDGSVRQFSSTAADYYMEPWRNNPDLIDRAITGNAEDGTFTVQVVDEQSRLNANVITPEQWKTLLRLSGADTETSNMIVDSIGDWIDKDSASKLNGAEDDYYMALSSDQGGPYHCKNASLDRIEELLLIRGMTPDIFYGHQGQSATEATYTGLAQFLTTLPFIKINVNTASSQALQCVPGVTAQLAEQLIRYRQGDDGIDGTDDDKPLQDAGAIANVWSGTMSRNEMRALANYLDVSSSFFTIYSTGAVGNVRRMIVATLFRNTDGSFSTISWNELTPR